MKLSLKQKALLITLAVLVGTIAGSFALAFILVNVTAETIGNVFMGGVLGFFVYLFYSIILNRLEYQESMKELNKKI